MYDYGCRGLVERDYNVTAYGSFGPPAQMPLIPRTEWADRIREMERTKSRLSDYRNDCGPNGSRIPSLNQNDPRYNTRQDARWGYCWAHGPVAAAILLRAKQGLPYVPLSAFGVAYTIKNRRDEGAWGALALDFITKRGIPPEPCPEHPDGWTRFEQRLRPESDPIWVAAQKYALTDGFQELTNPVWDRNMNFDQVMTCLLNLIPVCGDFNWWGHHVALLDPVITNSNPNPRTLEGFGIRIWNSWGDSWGEAGMDILTGSRMVPDNAVAPSVVVS